GVIPFEAATYMIAPVGPGAATKAGRWLTEATEMVATMTAMAARLPAIPVPGGGARTRCPPAARHGPPGQSARRGYRRSAPLAPHRPATRAPGPPASRTRPWSAVPG